MPIEFRNAAVSVTREFGENRLLDIDASKNPAILPRVGYGLNANSGESSCSAISLMA